MAPAPRTKKVKLARGDGTLTWDADRSRWKLRYSVDGTPFTAWGADHDECIAKRDANRAKLRGEMPPVVEGASLTVRAMFDRWLADPGTVHGKSKGTLESYRTSVNVVCRAAGHFDAVTINSVQARAILVKLTATHKSTSKYRSVLGMALQYLVDTGVRANNPLAGAKGVQSNDDLGNPTEWLLEEQAVATLAYLTANPSRDHAVLAVSMLAGLRPGEACALSWDAVDFDRGTIRVDFTVDRITGKASPKLKTDHHGERHRKAAHRTVPMSTELATILKRQRLATGGTGFAFPKGDGPLHPDALFYSSKAVSSALGHTSRFTGEPCHVSPNGYRHTFASRLAARGTVDPSVGAALMGHVNAAMWNTTYTHATVDIATLDMDAMLATRPMAS